jgi:hypothetical protein
MIKQLKPYQFAFGGCVLKNRVIKIHEALLLFIKRNFDKALHLIIFLQPAQCNISCCHKEIEYHNLSHTKMEASS